jgi:phosphoglycolate phosphatase-like HAD superfamily hydrolase
MSALVDFESRNAFLVAIDSDGCVFDTMEVKHKECFIPNIVRFFDLAAVSKYARECAEFVNLYSKWRGVNRFPGLILALDLLAERKEVSGRGFRIPKLPAVRRWLETETKLGNPALADAVKRTGDAELANLFAWSKAVNEAVELVVKKVPPFPFVRESLAGLASKADSIVCSATPTEALVREWEEHGVAQNVAKICGQEVGTKKEILAVAGKYAPNHVLMIGDAPGDLSAAQANRALFYPIVPGREDESWRRFHEEAAPRFFAGSYAGPYEAAVVAEFEASLPEKPHWN